MSSKAKSTIINAFLELVETEDFDKITVTSLVEKCNISRQTFYYHFNDIDEMLKYSFETETKAICDEQIVGSWYDSAEIYVDFLNRYDTLLRKAAATSKFIFIYDLLFNSFDTYIKDYTEKKKGRPTASTGNSKFLVDYTAAAFCGLVIIELQKEKSDYQTLLIHIAKSFKTLPKT